MKRLVPLLLLLAACSASLTALDPGVDATRRSEQLAARAPDTAGYVETAWLCLLHGQACDRLAPLPTGWQPEPGAELAAELLLFSLGVREWLTSLAALAALAAAFYLAARLRRLYANE